jgi:hypothetical protein
MKTIQDIIHTISENKVELGITLYQPAYYGEIENFERELSIKLPDEIKEFYRFCNGFESEEDMFRIIPLKEILESRKYFKPNHFYIAEYMVYCDMWEVVMNTINDKYKLQETSFKTILTDSFTEFLDRFIKGGVFGEDGLYDWKDQINSKIDN